MSGYVLHGWDEDWLRGNASLAPEEFASAYLRKRTQRFGKDPIRTSEKRLRQIILRNATHLPEISTQNRAQSVIHAAQNANRLIFYQIFRDFWRGFGEQTLRDEFRHVRKRVTAIRSQITRALKKARSGQEQAARISRAGRRDGFARMIAILEQAEKDAKAIDARRVAVERLQRHAFTDWGSIPVFTTDEIDRLELLLRISDPSRVTMPLRFLINEPLGLWIELNDAWQQRATRGHLLSIVEKHMPTEELFVCNNTMHEKLCTLGMRRRTQALTELQTSWDSNAFLSCALTATVQAEGMLWDLSDALNRRRILICRTKTKNGKKRRYAYRWDRKNKQYIRGTDDKIECNEKQYLKSARELLERTRPRSSANIKQ